MEFYKYLVAHDTYVPNDSDDIIIRLEKKITNEMNLFHEFFDSLTDKPTFSLMCNYAYMWVMYHDIEIALEDLEEFNMPILKALDESNYPISFIFDEWLSSDLSNMENIRMTIESII